MCRSIRQLRGADPPPTGDDTRAAALQFVRKISGYRVPSQANEEAFSAAVERIATASQELLDSLKRRSSTSGER